MNIPEIYTVTTAYNKLSILRYTIAEASTTAIFNPRDPGAYLKLRIAFLHDQSQKRNAPGVGLSHMHQRQTDPHHAPQNIAARRGFPLYTGILTITRSVTMESRAVDGQGAKHEKNAENIF